LVISANNVITNELGVNIWRKKVSLSGDSNLQHGPYTNVDSLCP